MPNKQQILDEYETRFGKINKELGYSLTARQTPDGWKVVKWYERNSWARVEQEHIAFFDRSGKFIKTEAF